MAVRTYIRTLLNDIFKNNVFIKVGSKIVNFYCETWFKNTKDIKFSANMPTNIPREKKTFSFQSVTGDKIDCK